MDPRSDKTKEETSAKDSELMELGQASMETRGGSFGSNWDNGVTYKPI